MRRIYILRDDEGDERVLDTLPKGVDPNELPNPQCPLCGSDTLLACVAEDEYHVLTWFSLSGEEEETASADAWYLICQEIDCPYEEQVERAVSPAGAELFDLDSAHSTFEECVGLGTRNPSELKELIEYLEAARQENPHRKLGAFLDEAEWLCEEKMEQVREWINVVPPGRKIEVHLNGRSIKAIFLTAAEETLLVQTLPAGEMLGIDIDALDSYGPNRFDKEDPPEADRKPFDKDRVLLNIGHSDYVVVRGYHLRLEMVDRFGQYHVCTWEPEAGVALGLGQQGETYWSGCLRRSEIEARYEKRRMVKVKGHWVKMYAETNKRLPAVYTENPEVAAALGLQIPQYPWLDEEERRRCVPRWYGVIPREQVEEWDEVCVYQWPIPEAKALGDGPDRT